VLYCFSYVAGDDPSYFDSAASNPASGHGFSYRQSQGKYGLGRDREMCVPRSWNNLSGDRGRRGQTGKGRVSPFFHQDHYGGVYSR
jgi:hypothetical protein